MNFTMEYWIEDDWYVGRLKEVPGVFSQDETLDELKENIKEAYRLIMKDEPIPVIPEVISHQIRVYTYSEARKKLAFVLEQAESTGKVLI